MEKLVLTIPALYADHHTIAIHGILEGVQGVSDIYVSAAWHQVSLRFDPELVSAAKIEEALAERGYEVGSLERPLAASGDRRPTRHTATHAGAGEVLAFVDSSPAPPDHPTWPCPGFDERPDAEE
jgi:copper chaperone CopZ